MFPGCGFEQIDASPSGQIVAYVDHLRRPQFPEAITNSVMQGMPLIFNQIGPGIETSRREVQDIRRQHKVHLNRREFAVVMKHLRDDKFPACINSAVAKTHVRASSVRYDS